MKFTDTRVMCGEFIDWLP